MEVLDTMFVGLYRIVASPACDPAIDEANSAEGLPDTMRLCCRHTWRIMRA